MNPPDHKLPSLDELQRKIDEAKPKSDEEPPESSANAYGNAMRMSLELVAGVGVGSVLGYFIDRTFSTSPVFLMVFVFLGFGAGVRNIMRSVKGSE